MSEKSENIENEVNRFKSFDDSLAGNQSYRERLLDTVSTILEFQQVRENQRIELTKKIAEFTTLYPDRDKVIMKYKIWDGLNDVINGIFVCMAIPLIIYVFKRK